LAHSRVFRRHLPINRQGLPLDSRTSQRDCRLRGFVPRPGCRLSRPISRRSCRLNSKHSLRVSLPISLLSRTPGKRLSMVSPVNRWPSSLVSLVRTLGCRVSNSSWLRRGCLDNLAGQQLQALEQQRLSQAYEEFQNRQRYPYSQLGFMSDILRGTPASGAISQLYQAPPSMLQQVTGAGLGLAGLYGATR
jgi:hypothetical protein